MADVLTEADEVTPGWLTSVLRDYGALSSGHVKGVEIVTSRKTPPSVLTSLRVDYSSKVDGTPPERMFLKVPRQERLPSDGKEVLFYDRVGSEIQGISLVRCFHAKYEERTGKSHLLLEDVSQSHYTIAWPLSPDRDVACSAVQSLAGVHARCWQHPLLGSDFGEIDTELSMAPYYESKRADLPGFFDFLGDRISVDRKRSIERVFERAPDLWIQRIQSGRLTLVHNDAHAWNILFPRNPKKDAVYIIDWQTYEPSIGPFDLAYMIAGFWYPSVRHELESDVLQFYHNNLQAAGVEDYPWDDCFNDYRLSVAATVFHPIHHPIDYDGAWLWYPRFEKILSAYEDLGCAEIL